MPPAHLGRLARAAAAGRAGELDAAPVETLLLAGGEHSWAYEDPGYRAAVAGFLTTALGGPLDAGRGGRRSPPRRPAERIPDPERGSPPSKRTPAGFRTLARVALPGATQRLGLRRRRGRCGRRGRRRRHRSAVDEPGTERVTDGVWQAVSTRRVVRRFADRPLEPDHLERILNAGRRATSSKNEQRWTFIVCRDRAHLQELGAVGPYAGHLAGAAVGIALVTPDPRDTEAPLSVLFDLGQAADSMMLVAWELGIGSVPATVYDQDLVHRLLELPGGPALRVPAVVRLPGGPVGPDPAAQGRRPPARSTRSSARSAGRRPAPGRAATASGTCGPRSRSRRRASRAARARTSTAARTPSPRP